MSDFNQAILEIIFMAIIPCIIALVFAVIFFKRKAAYNDILETEETAKLHRGYRYIVWLSFAFILVNVIFGVVLTNSTVNFYKDNLAKQKNKGGWVTVGRILTKLKGTLLQTQDDSPVDPSRQENKTSPQRLDNPLPNRLTNLQDNDRTTLCVIFGYMLFSIINLCIFYNIPFLFLILWIKRNFHKVGIDKRPIIIYAAFLIGILIAKTIIDFVSPMNRCPSTPPYKCPLVMTNVVFNVIKTLMSVGLILLMRSVPGSEILQMKITYRSGKSLGDEDFDPTTENLSDFTDLSNDGDKSQKVFWLEIDMKQTLDKLGNFGHKIWYTMREALPPTPTSGSGMISQNLLSDSFGRKNNWLISNPESSPLKRSLLGRNTDLREQGGQGKENPYGFGDMIEPSRNENSHNMMFNFSNNKTRKSQSGRGYGSDLEKMQSGKGSDNNGSMHKSHVLGGVNTSSDRKDNMSRSLVRSGVNSNQTQIRKVKKEIHKTEEQLIKLAQDLVKLGAKSNRKLELFEDLQHQNLNLEELEQIINDIMNNHNMSIGAEDFANEAKELFCKFLQIPKLITGKAQRVWLKNFSLVNQFPADFVLNGQLTRSLFPHYVTACIELTRRSDTFKLTILSSRDGTQKNLYKSLLSIESFAKSIFTKLKLPSVSSHPSFKAELGYLLNVCLNECPSPSLIASFMKSESSPKLALALFPSPQTDVSLSPQFNAKSNSLEYVLDFRFGLFEPSQVRVIRSQGHFQVLERNLVMRLGNDVSFDFVNFVHLNDVRDWIFSLLGCEGIWASTEFRLFMGFHEAK